MRKINKGSRIGSIGGINEEGNGMRQIPKLKTLDENSKGFGIYLFRTPFACKPRALKSSLSLLLFFLFPHPNHEFLFPIDLY